MYMCTTPDGGDQPLVNILLRTLRTIASFLRFTDRLCGAEGLVKILLLLASRRHKFHVLRRRPAKCNGNGNGNALSNSNMQRNGRGHEEDEHVSPANLGRNLWPMT
jgi:hypothetical protein